jgi:hypothetical protein
MRMIVEPKPQINFREWLDEQPLERKQEILRAERAYTREKEGRDDALLAAYEDSMEGYSESLDNRLDL